MIPESKFLEYFNNKNLLKISELLQSEAIDLEFIDIEMKSDFNALVNAAMFLYAAGCGYSRLLEYLLQNGANPEICDTEGHDALWCAVEGDANEKTFIVLVNAFAQKKEYINARSKLNKSELIQALENKLLQTIAQPKSKFPYYESVSSDLRQLISTLDPHYALKKLLDVIETGETELIVEALGCVKFEDACNSYYKIVTSKKYTSIEEDKNLGDYFAKTHSMLGYLQKALPSLEAYIAKNKTNNKLKNKCLAALDPLKTIKAELERYSYRNIGSYKANSAILFLTMLATAFKEVERANPSFEQPVLRFAGKSYNLKELASAIKSSVQVEGRSLAFIALGITKEGRVLATTNYHAPTVYDLETLLDQSKYKAVKERYHQQKITISCGKMHAETMLAALADRLDIETIVIIDQSGYKNQNCLYCSYYLFLQGFTNEPHFEGIKNYVIPTESEIEIVSNFLRSNLPQKHIEFLGQTPPRKAKPSSKITEEIFAMLPVKTQSKTQFSNSVMLKLIIDFCLKHYPCSSVSQNENITKLYAEPTKLVHFTDRTFIRKKVTTKKKTKELTSIQKTNTRLALQIDERVVQKDDSSLEAKHVHSPRSQILAFFGNQWLIAGGQGRVATNFTDQEMILNRNLR